MPVTRWCKGVRSVDKLQVSRRARGSLLLACTHLEENGGWLTPATLPRSSFPLVLSADTICNRIYVHDARYLSRPSEVAMHILSAPTYSSLSFYMRLSISPCGHYLASGSSGHGFGTHIWDVSKMGSNQNRTLWSQTNSPSAVLWGNTAEVNSLDWADDGVSDEKNKPSREACGSTVIYCGTPEQGGKGAEAYMQPLKLRASVSLTLTR